MPVRWLLAILVLIFYLLHQDIWFWRDARPIVFGVLPVGLFYHAVYTLAVSGLVWILIKYAWPSHLDDDGAPAAGAADSNEARKDTALRARR